VAERLEPSPPLNRPTTPPHNGPVLDRDRLVRRYAAYLDACNRRGWEELAQYVAESVLVNGAVRSRREYIADIVSTIAAFPDYHWELKRAVVEGEWLAVRLRDTGTRARAFGAAPADGARVETDEFDMYRIVDGLIVEVEGTADNARLAQ
jgi:aspartyl-tRNA synthetase